MLVKLACRGCSITSAAGFVVASDDTVTIANLPPAGAWPRAFPQRMLRVNGILLAAMPGR
jgi:hypothetical protein